MQRKIMLIVLRRKMNNYYTVMTYLTSQIKNASNYFKTQFNFTF